MRMAIADAFDSYISWLVFWLFLGALNLAMEASAYLVDENVGERLHGWAQIPTRLGLLVLLVAIIRFIWVRRKAQQQQAKAVLSDSYVLDAIKRSAVTAFFLTLPLVIILDVVTNNTELPADFYIKLPAFSLSAVFSVSFFFLNRSSAHERSEP